MSNSVTAVNSLYRALEDVEKAREWRKTAKKRFLAYRYATDALRESAARAYLGALADEKAARKRLKAEIRRAEDMLDVVR